VELVETRNDYSFSPAYGGCATAISHRSHTIGQKKFETKKKTGSRFPCIALASEEIRPCGGWERAGLNDDT